MNSKLDKLKELGDLLKSGVLTQPEFEKLKMEILNPGDVSIKNPKQKELDELLISGAITKEEFEALKIEILCPHINYDVVSKKEESVDKLRLLQLSGLYNSDNITLDELEEFYKCGGIPVDKYYIRKQRLTHPINEPTKQQKTISNNPNSETSKERNGGLGKPFSEKEMKLLGTKTYSNKETYSTKDWLQGFFVLAILLVIGGYMLTGLFGSDDSKSTKTTTKSISCLVCGKDLTNDYNRISPNGNNYYYCTLCYRKTMREINEKLKAEGY